MLLLRETLQRCVVRTLEAMVVCERCLWKLVIMTFCLVFGFANKDASIRFDPLRRKKDGQHPGASLSCPAQTFCPGEQAIMAFSLQAAPWKPESQKPIFMLSSKLILRIKHQFLRQPTVSERWLLNSKQVPFSFLSVVSVRLYEKKIESQVWGQSKEMLCRSQCRSD